MPDAIHGVGGSGISPINQPKGFDGPDATTPSFRDVLFEKIDEVNGLQRDAEKAAAELVAGKTDNVSEVFVAVQKADLAFKMLMQIRNKLLAAYQEINQLRI